MLLGMGVMILASVTYVAWRIYWVRSQIKGFKPMTQWFQTDNKGNFVQQNLKIMPEQLMKVVHFIQNPATSVMQKLDAIKLTTDKINEKGKTPSVPLPPPQCKLAGNGEAKTSVTLQTIECAVQGLAKDKSHIRRYQKYLAEQFQRTHKLNI